MKISINRWLVSTVGAVGLFASIFFVSEHWFSTSKNTKTSEPTAVHSEQVRLIHASGDIQVKLGDAPSGNTGKPDLSAQMQGAQPEVTCAHLARSSSSIGLSCVENGTIADAEHDASYTANTRYEEPMQDIQWVVERIAQGSILEAYDYVHMRDQCRGLLVTAEESDCEKLASVASVFKNSLERSAQQGDATAQKLLGLELVREVQAERNAVLMGSVERDSKVKPSSQNTSYSSFPQWEAALHYLQLAANSDIEAQTLLAEYSSKR